MPYAYVQQINHVFDTDHLKVYVTFRHQMQRSVIPQDDPPVYDWYPIPARWLLEADDLPIDIIGSEWIDEFTLLLTSDVVDPEPTGVTLAYAGPDEKLCYNWGKQIEPFGARESFTGYPTAPAPHNSTHENDGADEVNIAGLSGLAADTQHSFVDRGDPAVVDFDQNDLTKDSNWYDLDLSSIVPANTKAILLSVFGAATATNKIIAFRKNGNANEYNAGRLDTQAAGVRLDSQILVACDSSRVVEYFASTATWLYIGITVCGWFF